MRARSLALIASLLAAPFACHPEGSTPRAEPTRAASLELTRYEVRVDGHPIAVWGKRPQQLRGVIVLVHGRTWSARPDFDLQVVGASRSLMDALAARGYASYAIDLRGYGETPRDASGWLTPDRAAADLAGVLRWVGEREGAAPAVLGWSMGSIVSQLCAQRNPTLLSALVLYGYPRDPDAVYEDPSDLPALPEQKINTAEAAASDFRSPAVITPQVIDAFVAQALAADPVRVDWREAAQWNALDPGAVRVPTLILHGERDPYAPAEHQARLYARLGHPTRGWIVIPGADHAAHLEDTMPWFVQAALGFLERARDPAQRAR
ncbi:MAG: alpha/beta fold hydrolase [Nannocystaceae bacterium]|nr:alpha/beta fold hydrolase [Myxococcales bacterium]